MPNQKLRRWFEYLLGLLIDFIWKRWKKHMVDVSADATTGPSAVVNVPVAGGHVPVDAFATLAGIVPHIVDGLKRGDEPHEIYEKIKEDVLPEALTVGEAVLNIFLPGAGTILGLIIWMHGHSKPLTQEEENAWFDRFGIRNT